MDVIYLCLFSFHVLFSINSDFFSFKKRKNSLSALTLQRLFYLFVTVQIESECTVKMANFFYSVGCCFHSFFSLFMQSSTGALALEFRIHILLPLFRDSFYRCIRFVRVYHTFIKLAIATITHKQRENHV